MATLARRVINIVEALCAVPQIAEVMSDRVVAFQVYTILLESDLLASPLPGHTVSECKKAVVDAGYTVRKAPIAENENQKLTDDAPPVPGSETQQAMLLDQFLRAGEDGLTASARGCP